MRKFSLWLLLVAIALSGCAGSVFFGHKIGAQPVDTTTAPASTASKPEVAPVPAPPAAISPGPVTAPPAPVHIDPSAPSYLRSVDAVALAFTQQAHEMISADTGFKEDALLVAVERELKARKALNEGAGIARRTLEIRIDGFVTKASSNAVVLGYKLGTGKLTGDVKVRDADGQQLRVFRIEADSRISTKVNGVGPDPLGALYGKFAELTADDLTGSARKHDDTFNNQMPR